VDYNPTLQEVFDFLWEEYGYVSFTSYSTQPFQTCSIACYGTTSSVTHFSKITSGGYYWNCGSCVAKWGRCEIFDHTYLNPYYESPYGFLLAMFHHT
jgi:hypothetical protein